MKAERKRRIRREEEKALVWRKGDITLRVGWLLFLLREEGWGGRRARYKPERVQTGFFRRVPRSFESERKTGIC